MPLQLTSSHAAHDALCALRRAGGALLVLRQLESTQNVRLVQRNQMAAPLLGITSDCTTVEEQQVRIPWRC